MHVDFRRKLTKFVLFNFFQQQRNVVYFLFRANNFIYPKSILCHCLETSTVLSSGAFKILVIPRNSLGKENLESFYLPHLEAFTRFPDKIRTPDVELKITTVFLISNISNLVFVYFYVMEIVAQRYTRTSYQSFHCSKKYYPILRKRKDKWTLKSYNPKTIF